MTSTPRPCEYVYDHVTTCPLSHLVPVLVLTVGGITDRQYTPQVVSLRWMIPPGLPTSVSSMRQTCILIRLSRASVRQLHTSPTASGGLARAFDSLVELCLERRVAFLVVAGDVYDGPSSGLRHSLRFRDGWPACRTRHLELCRTWQSRPGRDRVSAFLVRGPSSSRSSNWNRQGGTCRVVWVPQLPCRAVSFDQRGEATNLALRFAHRAGPGIQVGVLHCNVQGAAPATTTTAPAHSTTARIGSIIGTGHVHARMVLSGRSGSDEPWWSTQATSRPRTPSRAKEA